MDHSDPTILVSTDWLAENLSNPSLRILDSTWHLPTEKRDALTEFHADHIPRAQFFDIDGISDAASHLPHMIPPKAQSEQQVPSVFGDIISQR